MNAVAIKEHRVTVFKDTNLEYPELWMEVFVTGPKQDQKGFAQLFAKAKCTKAASPEGADLVVFSGGDDVAPVLYGETRHMSTHFDMDRDKQETDLFNYCKDKGIPMLGICRGAQFLHVMNGGKLYQDVDGHMGEHVMWDVVKQKLIQRVSSVHHQSVMYNPKGGQIVLGDANKSTKRWKNASVFETGNNGDVEAYWYEDTMCLGIQGHPEYAGYHAFSQWSLQQIDTYILQSPHTELTSNLTGSKTRRIKKEVLEERKARDAAEAAIL